MKTVLLANGPISDYAVLRPVLNDCGYIIACDGGLRHARAFGVRPDCIVGDMDSAAPEEVARAVREGAELLRHPCDKDDTDLALGMAHALERSPSSVAVLGALGGRIDHQLSNMHVLAMALPLGVPASLIGEESCVRLTSGTLTFTRGCYDTVSLVPMSGEVTGIVTQGLFFPLRGETLALGTTRGISNRFTREEASVTVESGVLAVICVKA